MLIGIISDTHTRPLPQDCIARLETTELILHAGDFADAETLAAIRAIGPPVKAVHGNVDDSDIRRTLPGELLVKAGAATFAILHDAGPRANRLARMRKHFPKANAVVFGHSHIPLHEHEDGFHVFNPGSPTDRRSQPVHTMGLATVGHGTIAFEIVELP
ncbi:MAG: metallophosphoesterase family protein [Thermoleophilaceae bacterium]|nr:metallophosphoesterase family protein [Thermoleophilaceae bacterium]